MKARQWLRVLVCALFSTLFFGTATHIALAENGISSPTDGARVFGTITIRGMADAPNFASWQLDVLINGSAEALVPVAQSKKRVTADDVFARFDTRTLPDGSHKLRLRVIKINGQYDEFFVSFTLDNTNLPLTPIANAQTPRPTRVAVSPPTALNQISRPENNATVSGVVLISGFADTPDFLSWKLDLLFDGKPANVITIAAARNRHPTGDVMTSLDTTRLPNGAHLLRLRVSKLDNTFTESTSGLIILNQQAQPVSNPSPCPDNKWQTLPSISQGIVLALFRSYLAQIRAPCSL